MNIPTHTSNVIRSSNLLISTICKIRIDFQLLYLCIDEEIESYLPINHQIHNHDTRSNNQMRILRVNGSQTKHCILHNFRIIWNALTDLLKLSQTC